MKMNLDDFEIIDEFETNEVIEITKAINLLIDDGLSKMSIEQMEEVRSRHKLMLEQSIFWMSQGNYNRFFKDLREYGNWLLDYIAEAEMDFWGEEESS